MRRGIGAIAGELRSRSRRLAADGWFKAKAKARCRRVRTRVAPTDDMRDGDSLRFYFQVGESALEQIRDGLAAAGAGPPKRILDVPSGYGRVLRYLRAEWPEAEIAAMELQHDAARFCAAAFDARAILSTDPIWEVPDVGDDYDLVFCGSLLTHFDSGDWMPTLRFFRERLAPGGTVVFTTHGELSIDVLAREPRAVAMVSGLDYGIGSEANGMVARARRDGFAFVPYSADYSTTWGLSVSSPDWVRETVARIDGLRFVRFVPHGWFHHHDVWTYSRTD
jgi:SAM-dependent methyltransferase